MSLLPTLYQDYMHLSRYARWMPEQNRRELWPETIQRYMNFFSGYLGDNHDLQMTEAEYFHLEKMIATQGSLPSMRALAAAGPALARDHATGYNPVAGDTEVLTREYGVLPIEELDGQQASVLNVEGRWADAVFQCYGEQPVKLVRLKLNSNTVKEVRCTRNHRWVLSDGQVLDTESLRPGDRIKFVAAPRPELDDDYRLGVMHGLIYGDGTATRSHGRVNGYHIRICSDIEEILPWFEGYPVSYSESNGGDPVVMMYDSFAKTHALKELPSVDESESYLLGFVRGWMAADGSVSTSSQATLCTKKIGRDWLYAVAPKVGFVVQHDRVQPSRTNYGVRKENSHIVYFSRSSCVPEDFIITRKRDRFRKLESHYVVSAVENTNDVEPVYCANVPDTNTFTLAGGLVTGNCAYLPIDDYRAYGEMLYILACSSGVGFSVERQHVNKLPTVPDRLSESQHVIHVRDSKRGWAEAVDALFALLYAGSIPQWDTTQVRPAGAVLKTMGGRASGPEPLEDLFRFIIEIFLRAKGRKLNSQECHDIACKVGDIIIVGGVRRAALISLSNLSDQRMRDAKSGQWWEFAPWRALANNSVAYTEKPEVGQWMREWQALYDSKSGERGIFNREAARLQVMKYGRRKGYWDEDCQNPIEFGVNPCVPGDTPILTDEGYLPIESTVGRTVNVWNGEKFSEVQPFSTGFNETVVVNLSDGSSLRCTPNHKFIISDGLGYRLNEVRKIAEDLVPGDKLAKYRMPVVEAGEHYDVDAYSQGFYAGDGNEGLTSSWIYEPKYTCTYRLTGYVCADGDRDRMRWNHGPMLVRNFVPINGSLGYCLNWLAGLLDADGCVTRDKNGSGFQISATDRVFLNEVRLMLTRLGVRAKVIKGRPEGYRSLPDGRGGHYDCLCKADQRLLIGNTDAAHLMSLGLRLNRLKHDGQNPQRDARQYVRVVSVEDSEPCETFCFTEPDAHRGTFNGIVTGQCGEILLRPMEFCNLSSAIARADDTPESLVEKVAAATVFGTWQSCLTDFRHLRKEWKSNCDEEHLLGVSLSGIMDCPLLNGRGVSKAETADLCEHLREVVVNTNREWADRLGIPASKATTCVKPEGNSSQLVDSASGLHARFAKQYIRRVRQDNMDPLTQFMKDMGFPHEADVMKPDHQTVFSFPVRAPEGAVTGDEISAIEQLEHWKLIREHWCEHNPSITVTVRENEWPEVGAWVWKNFDDAAGLTFLPDAGHVYRQAPYEAVSSEKLVELEALMPVGVNWGDLATYEAEDHTTASRELACVSGVCEI